MVRWQLGWPWALMAEGQKQGGSKVAQGGTQSMLVGSWGTEGKGKGGILEEVSGLESGGSWKHGSSQESGTDRNRFLHPPTG